MLGYFKTASDVGIYNAVHSTAALMFILPAAFISLFLPVITELFSKRKINEIKDIFRKVSKWIFFVSFPVFLIMFFFSEHIINIIFGQNYITGATALSILVFGYLIHSFTHTAGNILSMKKKTKHIFMITFIFGISNILLNYFFIPIWGINGAAIATTTSYVIGSFFYLLSNKIWGIKIFFPVRIKPLIKSILAGIISIAFVYYITNLIFEQVPFYGFIVVFVIFIIVYSALLFIFRGFRKEDLELVKILPNKFKFNKKKG
jgi:O-antigen/teichoic acid export membrane protein